MPRATLSGLVGRLAHSAPWLLLFVAALLLANHLAFLCDDAFITFRHVANAHEGHGLVYNREPFAPVEGSTCLLWALGLWAAWSLTGVEPPDSANVLSIACGLLQLLLVVTAARSIRRRDGSRVSALVAWTAAATVATNRTFVQWFTSGLETALFNLALLAWVLHMFRATPTERRSRWLTVAAGLATIASATRPDGLLLVAATAATALLARRAFGLPWRGLLVASWPLLGVLAIAAFRLATYGELLPNTYYAKVAGLWPEAGWRYLLCFAVEHGTWLVTLLGAGWLLAAVVRRTFATWVGAGLPRTIAVTTVLLHAGYYVVVVGGDHFEYRVLSQLVPLSVLATAVMASSFSDRRLVPISVLVAVWLASSLGWLHWAVTRDLPANGFHPLTPRVPPVLRPFAAAYDRHQCWLHLHYIGLRCNQHAVALAGFRGELPPRAHRGPTANDDVPVHVAIAAGYCSWVMPDLAILDTLGLNDWVIARSPSMWSGATADGLRAVFAAGDTDRDGWFTTEEARALAAVGGLPDLGLALDSLWVLGSGERPGSLAKADMDALADSFVERGHMAHERQAPPGYIEAFAPNVTADRDGVRIAPRAVPLTADRVRAVEAAWRSWIRRGAPADNRPRLP